MQSVRYNFDGKNADLPLKTLVDMLLVAIRPHLTPRQYEVLWAHEVEGLSGKEIAYKLGIDGSAVS